MAPIHSELRGSAGDVGLGEISGREAADLPDDSGEIQYQAELPDDSGEDRTVIFDVTASSIEKSISTAEGIQELIERHPEKSEVLKGGLEAVTILNDPDASPAELRSAQAKLSGLKGQLLELAAKDALSDAGLTVTAKQHLVEGESGGTKPDIVAQNEGNAPVEVFGLTVQPGETLSAECKCGSSLYIKGELKDHIPNQLSGHQGHGLLITTSDVLAGAAGLAEQVCDKYGATLVVLGVDVNSVERAIKEVSEQ